MVNYSGTYATPRLDLGVAFQEHAMDIADFVGLKVFPIFRTMKRDGTFSAITRETLLQDAETRRAARATYNRINMGAKDKSYACEEYGVEQVVDDSERAFYASDFDAESAAMMISARVLQLQHEERVAALIQDTAVFTGAAYFTDYSASPWSTVSTDIPSQIIDAAEKVRQNCGMQANALILSAAQVPNLLKNTKIQAQFPGAPLITLKMIEQALPSIFGLERLIVGKARKNTAKEGQTFSGADVWTDVHVMVGVVCDDGAPLSEPCLGRTFLWTPDSPTDSVAEMYREEQSRGDVLRVRQNVDELLLDKNFGHLLDVKA